MSAQPVELDVAPARTPVGDEPRLRLLPAPVREPAATPLRVAPAVPAVLPAPLVTRPVVRQAVVPVPLQPADEPVRPAVRTPSTELPDPQRWAGQFVQAAVEVSIGLRPVTQLVRWTTEEVYALLSRRHDVATRARRSGRLTVPPGRTRVRSVRTEEIRDGVVEASAVVVDGTRARAVALRLEGLDGRWQVGAFVLG